MDLVCNNCNQPNPPGSRLCSRCSSVFPVVASETLIDPGAKPGFVATGTILDPVQSGTMIPPGGSSGTMISAAVGSGTMVDVGAGTRTVIVPPDGGAAAPLRNVVRPPSQGSGPRARVDSGAFAAGTVEPGARLGSRYEIVKLLGKGGMGAVYLARDLDLGRDVAMKLIAPHLANEAAVLERFKREIQLSSIVTHPNVLRVYDLGDADGIKFLTMQFIEGETLADLLAREKPLPLDRILPIFRQICDGLAAAHEKAVFHRDLKPQNVMMDPEGHVYLMDFGLATSRTMTAMTQAGAVMGTPQYMSPEQVKGTATDGRSDIFSLGVMLYEMLSGELPFTGDSLFEIMVKRTLGPPRPAAELNPRIPKYLQQLLERCLAIDPVQRYQTMEELLFDLDAGSVKSPIKRRRGPSRTTLLLGGVLLGVLALGVGGTMMATQLGKPSGPPKPVTVLVGDFDNRTGEDIFNRTFEPALSTQLEGASFVTSYSRNAAIKAADQLKLEGTGLPEKRARLIAQREGIAVVTTGFIEKDGAGYRLGIRAVDAFTGQRLMEETAEVNKEKALGGLASLAAKLRNSLGDATPVGTQLKETETYSAASLEAAHEYAVAVSFRDQGKFEEAKRSYAQAIKLDPNLGRAYSGIATIDTNLGRYAEAGSNFKEALARIDRMSEREKLRTLGVYYLFSHDPDRAIEAFTNLLKQFPNDYVGLVNLGYSHQIKHDFARALESYQRAVTLSPNDPVKRTNAGYSALYTGDVEMALTELRKAIELGPVYGDAHVGLALAELAKGNRDAAVSVWEKLRGLSATGASTAVEGLADLALYEGRLKDAERMLQDGLKADVAAKEVDGAARKLITIAEVRAALGDRRGAMAAADRALKSGGTEHIAYAGAVLRATNGDAERALAMAQSLGEKTTLDARMYAELARAWVEIARGNGAEGILAARRGIDILDTWLARYTAGRAYFEARNYAAALDEFDRCEKRRGETADAFQANTFPTFHFSEAARYYLARTHDALTSPAAAEKYRSFLSVKKGDEDPLVADARARLAKLGVAASAAGGATK